MILSICIYESSNCPTTLIKCGIAPAAAAKLLQSCPTLCNPIDISSPGFPVPGILQARTLEWVAISFSNAGDIRAAAAAAKSLQSCPILCHPLPLPVSRAILGFNHLLFWPLFAPLQPQWPSCSSYILLLLLSCFSRVQLCATS